MGNESSTMQGTTEKTSVIDDIGSWWDALNLEEWAKGVLDDIEQAVTGSKTLSKVAFAPDAVWQPDDARGTCNLCDKSWGLTRRRHHCRHCGLLYCSACADHFLYMTQNSIRFKFRICTDCNDDPETVENVKNGGASDAVEGVTKVVQAVGAAAKQQRRTSEAEIRLPNNDELMKAIGMEEGEELAIGAGCTVVATSAAVVASPDDPFEADQFGTTNVTHDEPWWEDSYFDGDFSGSSAGSWAYTTASMENSAAPERFLTYSDVLHDEPSAFATFDAGPDAGSKASTTRATGADNVQDANGSDGARALMHPDRPSNSLDGDDDDDLIALHLGGGPLGVGSITEPEPELPEPIE